jgi:predicted membrane-bound dolichyl-phosphate-mannose-protein mannosyltransferase
MIDTVVKEKTMVCLECPALVDYLIKISFLVSEYPAVWRR